MSIGIGSAETGGRESDPLRQPSFLADPRKIGRLSAAFQIATG